MKQQIHPLADPQLYAKAERAASAVLASPIATYDRRRQIQLMEKAARDIFKTAGAAPDVADFYATSITCDILERIEVMRQRRNAQANALN